MEALSRRLALLPLEDHSLASSHWHEESLAKQLPDEEYVFSEYSGGSCDSPVSDMSGSTTPSPLEGCSPTSVIRDDQQTWQLLQETAGQIRNFRIDRHVSDSQGYGSQGGICAEQIWVGKESVGPVPWQHGAFAMQDNFFLSASSRVQQWPSKSLYKEPENRDNVRPQPYWQPPCNGNFSCCQNQWQMTQPLYPLPPNTLPYNHNNQRGRMKPTAPSGGPMRAVFLQGTSSGREAGGTGVFIPPCIAGGSNYRKKVSCSMVLIPTHLEQALNTSMDTSYMHQQQMQRAPANCSGSHGFRPAAANVQAAKPWPSRVYNSDIRGSHINSAQPVRTVFAGGVELPADWTY